MCANYTKKNLMVFNQVKKMSDYNKLGVLPVKL